ncbi:hypothetical protein [Rhodococcus sp. ACS1]|uniref:hypothetical protein n=1 Tax=Rhodococcus sp. ACS1 TaxID=2028570 RepID=UPI00211C6F3B|nr:hypothetical protein [Rhodococcus sp. ACS1]
MAALTAGLHRQAPIVVALGISGAHESTLCFVTLLTLPAMNQLGGGGMRYSSLEQAVWNRTISRAEPLEEAGVSVHADVGSALDASDAVVLTVLDLDSALKILDGHFAALDGKAVINLMSGTPALAGTFYTAGLGAFCEALAFLRDGNIDPTRPEVALDYWFELFRRKRCSSWIMVTKKTSPRQRRHLPCTVPQYDSGEAPCWPLVSATALWLRHSRTWRSPMKLGTEIPA